MNTDEYGANEAPTAGARRLGLWPGLCLQAKVNRLKAEKELASIEPEGDDRQ